MLQEKNHKKISPFRLNSIRGQIIAFAILAALIPALAISLMAYAQSRRALTEKISQELVTSGSQAAREADVWLRERLYDLRVFASSSVVSETVSHGGGRQRLAEYLRAVRGRFADYEELQLLDAKGGLIASSATGAAMRIAFAATSSGGRRRLETKKPVAWERLEMPPSADVTTIAVA